MKFGENMLLWKRGFGLNSEFSPETVWWVVTQPFATPRNSTPLRFLGLIALWDYQNNGEAFQQGSLALALKAFGQSSPKMSNCIMDGSKHNRNFPRKSILVFLHHSFTMMMATFS